MSQEWGQQEAEEGSRAALGSSQGRGQDIQMTWSHCRAVAMPVVPHLLCTMMAALGSPVVPDV